MFSTKPWLVTVTVSLNANADLHSGLDLPVGIDVQCLWFNHCCTKLRVAYGSAMMLWQSGFSIFWRAAFSAWGFLQLQVMPLAVSRQPRTAVEEQASVFTTCVHMNIQGSHWTALWECPSGGGGEAEGKKIIQNTFDALRWYIIIVCCKPYITK